VCPESQQVLVSVPFTLKDYPRKISELRLGNDFACLPFEFNFPKNRQISSLKEVVAGIRRQVRSANSIFLAWGFYYMMNYFVSLLRYNMQRRPYNICANYTCVFSCVPGPRKPWRFQGLQVRELYYLVPGAGDLGCGIGVITHGDHCQIAVGCDARYFPNSTEVTFIQEFERIFEQGIDHLE
jgi:hypothetical protein